MTVKKKIYNKFQKLIYLFNLFLFISANIDYIKIYINYFK